MEINDNSISVRTDELFGKVAALIEEARRRVATALNVAEVYTKFEIGRYIVEDEQEGKYKAAYGKRVLAQLASQLQSKFGQGWGEDVLGNCRKFYTVYSQPQISDTVCRKSLETQESEDFRYTVSEFQNAPAVPHKFVNYYDRHVRQEFEKPTVGILLCKEKNDALVELTLPKDANIYASQYEFYLPDKKELQEKLRSWVEEFENEAEK